VPRVVAAGALIPIKGYDVLLEAFGELAASGVPFELLLAGDGPERNRLERQAISLGIGERVKFLGEIDDVPALLSTAHIAVHPSRSEGLSNTILEAMAEGLPVVATNVGGTPEIINDNRSGLLVPPNDAHSLAAKVRLLLDRPDLRAQLGSAGLEVVRQRFNVERVATQYEHIYESVLSAEPAPRVAADNAS
jgi:glycosyltransferase involved in cell wall biosynthesis